MKYRIDAGGSMPAFVEYLRHVDPVSAPDAARTRSLPHAAGE
jgi:hypothetical protein